MAPDSIREIIRQFDAFKADVTKRFDEQDRTYAQRRQEDDARDARAREERQLVVDRVDAHGKRQTAADTRWEAFFGPQGAFHMFTNQIREVDSKADLLEKGQGDIHLKLDQILNRTQTFNRKDVWGFVKTALTIIIAMLALLMSYVGYRAAQTPARPITSIHTDSKNQNAGVE